MGILYVNANGEEITRHSYSAGQEFDECPLKFKLRRILGWREKDAKASLLFGRALESAVQYFHDTKGQGGVEEFIRLWVSHKNNDKLSYTAVEGNWESLNRAGIEMLKLYAILQPKLPMPLGTQFQREFLKEVFPGDERLGGIEFYGKIDALPMVDPHHPLLPKVEWNEKMGMLRPVITDLKTTGMDGDLDDTPGIVAHDLQLRMYAWLRGVFDVAFLRFKKAKHEIAKGSRVTMLETVGTFEAGTEAYVAQVNKDDNFTVYLLKTDEQMDAMGEAQGRKENGNLETTKVAVARRDAWLEINALRVEQYKLTKQRIHYSSGRVSQADAMDAGQIVADQIARIVNAWETNKFTNTFGIRFPHDNRRDAFFRAFVMKDNMFRDGMFEQRYDDFFDDEIQEDEAQ